MTAAALWAGCGNSEKKTDESTVQKDVAQSVAAQKDVVRNDVAQNVRKTERPVENVGTFEKPVDTIKEGLLKKATNVMRVQSEITKIRALYGVVERDFGNAVALYGVRPVDDGTVNVPRNGPVARCLVEDIKPEDIVVGEGSDIRPEIVLKMARQRASAFRHICNKALYSKKYRTERTKEFSAKIALTVKIATNGLVENVQIQSTTIAEKSVLSVINGEIEKSVSRWRFPKNQSGGLVTISVSLYEKFPTARMDRSK